MNVLDLETAVSIHPVVWVTGEPLLAFNAAIELLTEKGQRSGSWNIVHVWNITNGLVFIPETIAIEGDMIKRWFTTKVKAERDAATDLLTGLLTSPALVVFCDGMKLGPPVSHAAMRLIEDGSRRVVFVSSTEPPGDFLPDYLAVVEYEEKFDSDTAEGVCAQNKDNDSLRFKENAKFQDEIMSPLVGLRPYRALTNLMEAIKLAEKNKVVDYLYQVRASTISNESEGSVTLEEPAERFMSLVGLDRAKRLLGALAGKVAAGESIRGVIQVGIAGCGKSTLSRAVAGEFGLPLYIVDIGSNSDKYVGETQRKSRRTIQILKNAPHGICLFDELEKSFSASASGSASGDSGTAKQSNAYYLNYLTNPQAADGNHLILATSNDISSLPPEWTRAGRWDATLYFGFPTEASLQKILEMYRTRFGLPKLFGKGVELAGYTPAEVESTCRIAGVLGTKNWDDAAVFVPKIKVQREEEIAALENWAVGRAVSADDDDVKLGKRSERVIR